jgi:hypothetical protein
MQQSIFNSALTMFDDVFPLLSVSSAAMKPQPQDRMAICLTAPSKSWPHMGDNYMSHELRTRRKEIEIQVELSEKELSEARTSGALGAHSRTMLLYLERKIHASKKALASLDSQLAKSCQASCNAMKE